MLASSLFERLSAIAPPVLGVLVDAAIKGTAILLLRSSSRFHRWDAGWSTSKT